MNKIKNEKSAKVIALILMGLMLFSVTGVFAEGNINISSQENISSQVVYPANVKIISEKRFAEYSGDGMGIAFYKILIKDNHKPILDVEGNPKKYEYSFDFEPIEPGLQGSFKKDSVILKAGEKEIVEFKVITKNYGATPFFVRVENEGRVLDLKEVIVLSKEKPFLNSLLNGNNNFFIGEGFIVNKDESKGNKINLKLLDEDKEKLFGKIRIGQENFKVKGFVDKENVKFELFEILSNSDRRAIIDKSASFIGTFKKYENFKLLKGTLINFKGEDWDLTAMYNNRGEIVSIDASKKENVYSIGLRGVIAIPKISEKSKDEEIYINPIKVREKKFLGFIPTGKKLVEVEIIKGDKIFTKEITEYKERNIEGYRVSVGSLADENNIEFNISE